MHLKYKTGASAMKLPFLLVKKEVYVTRHQCGESAVDDLGAVVEVGFHSAGAVEAVDGEGRLKDDVLFLGQRAVNVASARLGVNALNAAFGCDTALGEVEVAQSRGHCRVENGGKNVGLERLRHDAPLFADLIVGQTVLLEGFDQLAVKHLVEALGKVEEHNVICLHHDVVDGAVFEGVVYIFKKIKHEDLDRALASDG